MAESNVVVGLDIGTTKILCLVAEVSGPGLDALVISEGIGGIASMLQSPALLSHNFADDTAAATGGVPVGGLYHNAGQVRIRVV